MAKWLKSFRLEIKDGRHDRHLENLFFASSPELKGHLTQNLVGRIGVTCIDLKMLKLFGSEIQDGGHLETLFFFFFFFLHIFLNQRAC